MLNLLIVYSDKEVRRQRGQYMTSKVSTFFTFSFCFMFFAFLAVHHAHMKTPSQGRGIASSKTVVKPWYDASYKF